MGLRLALVNARDHVWKLCSTASISLVLDVMTARVLGKELGVGGYPLDGNLLGMPFVVDEINGALPTSEFTEECLREREECPECYDTGFKFGIGVACSRGCKP